MMDENRRLIVALKPKVTFLPRQAVNYPTTSALQN